MPRLHLVTDDRVLGRADFLERARTSIEAGGERIALHLRGPRTPGRRLWDLGCELRASTRASGTPLIVNDRVDLALVLRASGVQLGRRSFTVEGARALLGRDLLIGCSVHEVDQARALDRGEGGGRGSDFILVGTLYPTPSHPKRAGAGPERLTEVGRAAPGLPALGIGGVTVERVPAVMRAGAYGVAVVRAVWDAEDPGQAVRALLQRLDMGLQHGATRGAPGRNDR